MMAAVLLGTRHVPAVPAEVAGVRRWLAGLLGKEHHPILDDVVLLACELITNSILHSDSATPGEDGEPGTVTLAVSATHDTVRVEITDAGSDTNTPTVITDDQDAPNGRGLYLLTAISHRWDTHTDDNCRTTWFEITTDPDPANPAPERR